MSAFTDLEARLIDGQLWQNPRDGNQQRGLVFVHGFGAEAREYAGLVKFLIEEIDPVAVLPFRWGVGPKWLTWGHGVPLVGRVFNRALSQEHPEKIVESLVDGIRSFLKRFPDARLTMVGHSMGSVFLRAAYLELEAAEQEKIDGMVFLAPTSRGYLADDPRKKTQLYFAERIPWCAATLLSVAVGLFGYFTIGQATVPWSFMLFFVSVLLLLAGRLFPLFTVFHLLRGADWITGIRLRWIELIAAESTPRTASIRGGKDSLIGDFDDLESENDLNAAEQQVLADVNHHHFKLTPVTTGHAKGLTKVRDHLQQAIVDALQWIAGDEQSPVKWAPSSTQPRVFLIHGIRDFADWHEPLGYAIEQSFAARPGGEAAKIVSITYGYFSAFQFLLPGERIRCSRVFRDRYVFERAQAPTADFYAFAHSNGTFVLGHVIKTTPGTRLTSVVLAGSVLNRDFDWPKHARAERVGNAASVASGRAPVVNFRASKDYPVGFLCRGLSGVVPNLPWLLPLLAVLGLFAAFVASWCFGANDPLSMLSAWPQILRSADRWQWAFATLVAMTICYIFCFVGVPYRNIGTAGVDGFWHRGDNHDIVLEPDVLDGGHSAALEPRFHSMVGDHFANNPCWVDGSGQWPPREHQWKAWAANVFWALSCRSNPAAVLVLTILISALTFAFFALLTWASPTVLWAAILSAALTFIAVRILHYA